MSERDFAEFIRILVRRRVRFLIVGGYAMAHHGLPRATNDVDVLVATDERNRARLRAAAIEFVGVAPSESALSADFEDSSSPAANASRPSADSGEPVLDVAGPRLRAVSA